MAMHTTCTGMGWVVAPKKQQYPGYKVPLHQVEPVLTMSAP
eukprot:SAG11_NODE_17663_length_512_cov_0.932203_1_plen_40_part_01